MTDVPAARDLTLEQQVPLLSGGGHWRTQAIDAVGVPAVVLADGPHGLRVQPAGSDHLGMGTSVPATCFPPAATLASSWDEELATAVGRAVGVEALALGVDVVLGPGLNIKRHPLGGRNFEYLSEDPLLAGRLAAAVVRGTQSTGVGACLKHFAVNNQESHRFVVDAVVDERTLRELYLAGFEHAVKHSRPRTVMASYNLVNGSPATEHHRLLTEILRDEWGFDGLVMSDWGAVGDRVAAVAAGLDLEMPSSRRFFDRAVLDAVASGELPAAAVEASAQRVLDLVARSPRHTPTPPPSLSLSNGVPVDEHDALARRAAAECTVVLTNDGLLPLAEGRSVALIGAFATEPRYQGSGSSRVNPLRVTTALDALRERGVEVHHARGYDTGHDTSHDTSQDTDALVAEAVDAARRADVAVVMVGLPDTHESEGFDRTDLALPAQHDRLVAAVTAANPRTVVALSNGAPVAMPWKDAPAAILECYLGGQASGGALVDVLYGDVEPAGRLAETFPVARTDLAADRSFPGRPRMVEYREGLLVGYRHCTTSGPRPLFPFGHGLGYASFDWAEVDVDATEVTPGQDVTVGVTVTNAGERDGSDVVQVYLHDRTGVVARPRRTLAGFAKVRLAAGGARRVSVTVPARALAFWDVEAGDWRTPSGRLDLEVARSSEDVVATVPVTVVGGVDHAPVAASGDLADLSRAAFEARLGRRVPTPRPVRPFTRGSTIGEVSSTLLGRALRAALWRAAPLDDSLQDDAAAMAMFERGIEELPLYGAANFSDGRIRPATLDALVDLLNRQPGRALGRGAAALAGRRRRGARTRPKG